MNRRTLFPLGVLAAAALLGMWLVREPHRGVPSEPLVAPPPVQSGARVRTPGELVAAPALPSTGIAVPPALSILQGPFSEEDYLRQLRAFNLSDKSAAFALAEQGDQWYGAEGPAAEARRAMQITLLVDLDRMDEARVRTRRFIEQYPESPYRRLVQGVTGIHPRPTRPPLP